MRLQSRLDKLDETSSLTARANQKRVDELKDQLERARRQASLAAGDAKDEALKKVEETRAQLVAAQQQAQQQLTSDISKVKEQTETVDSRVSQVSSDVTGVKGDVATTRSQLEKTVAELKRATGDIDGHSVLIATNGKELAALKALGERNFIEFTIHKQKQFQKVGDVSILLKNADPKKNRYTIQLTADDKTTEKKDRGSQRTGAVPDIQGQAAVRAGGERRQEGHHRRVPLGSESAELQELGAPGRSPGVRSLRWVRARERAPASPGAPD